MTLSEHGDSTIARPEILQKQKTKLEHSSITSPVTSKTSPALPIRRRISDLKLQHLQLPP